MQSLGSDAVIIGSRFSVAAVGGLKDGVTHYIHLIAAKLLAAMVLTGTAKANAVDRTIRGS